MIEENEDAASFPNALEFSPGQQRKSIGHIDFDWLMESAARLEGSYNDFVEAVRLRYFAEGAVRKEGEARLRQQKTRAKNVIWGMRAYGLYDIEEARLTPVGYSILEEVPGLPRVVALAKHILLNLHGLDVIDALRSLEARREKPDKTNLASELERRGHTFSANPTKHTKMVNWLQAAGVLEGYRVVDDKLAELLGTRSEEISSLATLPRLPKAFLMNLKRLTATHGNDWIPSSHVTELVEAEVGPIVKSHLKEHVRNPLEALGYLEQSDVGPGRGGKSGQVRATQKLLDLDPRVLENLPRYALPRDLVAKMDLPLDEVRRMLGSGHKHAKGLGLELLALKLMTDVGLNPVYFRLRAAQAGFAEVDLICEGAHLAYSRWMVQCKNTARVEVADLAREIGMATIYKAHVIVIITTGRFSETVRAHAERLTKSTSLQTVLIDDLVLKGYFARGGTAMIDFLRESASDTLRLKQHQYELSDEAAEV
jgi:hypothetical protein